MGLFEVGDKVRIKKRTDISENYRFSFIDEMAEMSGTEAIIYSKRPAYTMKPTIEDDGYQYSLLINGIESEYKWASSMLEPITGSNLIVVNDEDSVKLNFKL